MTIDEIINYVLHTPHNTNPNVLRNMLERFAEECQQKSNFVLADDSQLYVKSQDAGEYDLFTVAE